MNLSAPLFVIGPVADRIAEVAIAALWQGALIAGVLAVCLRFLPRISAAYRFFAWTVAFLVSIALSLFSLAPGFFVESAHTSESAAGSLIPSALNHPLVNLDSRWSVAIVLLWIAVAMYRAADLAIHSLRLRKLWKDAKPIELEGRVEALLNTVVTEAARQPVEVCTTATLERPSVIGFFKPRILIPDWLYARLTQSELEQIVLHEAEHLRRRDDWTNLLQKICLVVFPLNPALAWIERRLCREREMACDEGVVRVTRAPRAYAACLASLAERGLERRVEALSLGAWQRRPEVVHRVHSILRSKVGLKPWGARIMVGTLGCGLLAGSFELAQSPQLVAFVPKHQAETANVPDHHNDADKAFAPPARLDSAMTREKNSSGSARVVAINTSLREPSNAGKPDVRPSHETEARSKTGGIAATPVAAALKPQSEAHVAQAQHWIVLTTWQQVDLASDKTNAGIRSDYTAQVSSTEGVSAETKRNIDRVPGAANRTTVTQLILRVMPADAERDSATKPAASPSMNQLGIAAIRDGWIVIQL